MRLYRIYKCEAFLSTTYTFNFSCNQTILSTVFDYEWTLLKKNGLYLQDFWLINDFIQMVLEWWHMVTSKCHMDRFGTKWNQRRCGSTQIFTSLVSYSSVSNCHCYSIFCRKVRLFFNLICNSVMPFSCTRSKIILDESQSFWTEPKITLHFIMYIILIFDPYPIHFELLQSILDWSKRI